MSCVIISLQSYHTYWPILCDHSLACGIIVTGLHEWSLLNCAFSFMRCANQLPISSHESFASSPTDDSLAIFMCSHGRSFLLGAMNLQETCISLHTFYNTGGDKQGMYKTYNSLNTWLADQDYPESMWYLLATHSCVACFLE